MINVPLRIVLSDKTDQRLLMRCEPTDSLEALVRKARGTAVTSSSSSSFSVSLVDNDNERWHIPDLQTPLSDIYSNPKFASSGSTSTIEIVETSSASALSSYPPSMVQSFSTIDRRPSTVSEEHEQPPAVVVVPYVRGFGSLHHKLFQSLGRLVHSRTAPDWQITRDDFDKFALFHESKRTPRCIGDEVVGLNVWLVNELMHLSGFFYRETYQLNDGSFAKVGAATPPPHNPLSFFQTPSFILRLLFRLLFCFYPAYPLLPISYPTLLPLSPPTLLSLSPTSHLPLTSLSPPSHLPLTDATNLGTAGRRGDVDRCTGRYQRLAWARTRAQIQARTRTRAGARTRTRTRT